VSKFIVGDYFRRNGGGAQYGPTMPRGGDAVVFGVEILAADASTSLDMVVEHKNVEDTSWTTLVTMSAMTSGVNTATASGVKEQFRFAFTVNGSNPWNSVYANVLAPMWRPY